MEQITCVNLGMPVFKWKLDTLEIFQNIFVNYWFLPIIIPQLGIKQSSYPFVIYA
jgi:hypothetical protein